MCLAAPTTDANGIYVIDMVPLASGCQPIGFSFPTLGIRKVGYELAGRTIMLNYRDNPSASFDDLHSFWEVQNFELVPGKWAQVELLSFDISRARVTNEAEYLVSLKTPQVEGAFCRGEANGYITSPDPPAIEPEQELRCGFQSDQVHATVTVSVVETGSPGRRSDVSTAGFSWTVPDGDTGWLTATLDSADAAGPDDPDLEFTAQIRYRSVTEDSVLP
jgi:hypothetical protein